jgi:hypothetical protein
VRKGAVDAVLAVGRLQLHLAGDDLAQRLHELLLRLGVEGRLGAGSVPALLPLGGDVFHRLGADLHPLALEGVLEPPGLRGEILDGRHGAAHRLAERLDVGTDIDVVADHPVLDEVAVRAADLHGHADDVLLAGLLERLLRLHGDRDLRVADQLGGLVRDLLAGRGLGCGVERLQRRDVGVHVELEGERLLLAELLEGLVELLAGGELLHRAAGGGAREDGTDDGGGGQGLAYGADDGLLVGPITV